MFCDVSFPFGLKHLKLGCKTNLTRRSYVEGIGPGDFFYGTAKNSAVLRRGFVKKKAKGIRKYSGKPSFSMVKPTSTR